MYEEFFCNLFRAFISSNFHERSICVKEFREKNFSCATCVERKDTTRQVKLVEY